MATKVKTKAKDPTHVILGMSTSNEVIHSPISKFPHALIAGTTGSGKSVFLESMLTSMFTHADPKELKVIIVDPKGNEFGNYKDLPFMLCNPITDKDKSPDSLEYLATEMDVRFQKFNKYGLELGSSIKNLSQYNRLVDKGKIKDEKMPYVVLLIDELFDLMSTHKDSVEMSIKRLGAKSRAAGIHMILATQSPRREVVTGLIKANVPTKISLMVGSSTESMIILEQTGAEKLKPHGDFYASINGTAMVRGQAPFVDNETELPEIFEYLRKKHPKPDLVDISEELERKKEEFANIKAEISGESVEDIKAEADNFHKGKGRSKSEPRVPKTDTSEESEEKKERRKRHSTMMKQIEENRKNKNSKKPKKVSVDTSALNLEKRNEMRKEKGIEPRKPTNGIVSMSSTRSKPNKPKEDKKVVNKKERSQTSNEAHTEPPKTRTTQSSNVSQMKTTQSKQQTNPKPQRNVQNSRVQQGNPLHDRRNRVAKAPSTNQGNPLARKR